MCRSGPFAPRKVGDLHLSSAFRRLLLPQVVMREVLSPAVLFCLVDEAMAVQVEEELLF